MATSPCSPHDAVSRGKGKTRGTVGQTGHDKVKIISGGQIGVDRAALHVAIGQGLAYGGWCPKGGWAEDLTNPPGVLAFYPDLRETPDADPGQRTAWNVRDSDGLMVLTDIAGLGVSKGTLEAVRCAARLGRPHIIMDLDRDAAGRARNWLDNRGTDFAVCIAGPRESEAPGIYAKAKAFLEALFEH
jgi:hypothetical protein